MAHVVAAVADLREDRIAERLRAGLVGGRGRACEDERHDRDREDDAARGGVAAASHAAIVTDRWRGNLRFRSSG